MMLAKHLLCKASATDEDVSAMGLITRPYLLNKALMRASNQNEVTENRQDASSGDSAATAQVADNKATDRAPRQRKATHDASDDELSAPAVSGTEERTGGWP